MTISKSDRDGSIIAVADLPSPSRSLPRSARCPIKRGVLVSRRAADAALGVMPVDEAQRSGYAHITGMARDLLSTLRSRELAEACDAIAARTGLPHRPSAEGDA